MAEHSASEMMVVAAARQLADGQVIFVGIGLPAWLPSLPSAPTPRGPCSSARIGTGHLLEAKLLIRQGLAPDWPEVAGTFSRAHPPLRPVGQPRAGGEAGPVPRTARGSAPRGGPGA